MCEQQNFIDSQQSFIPKQNMSCIVCGKLYSSKHFLQKHIMLHRLCPVEPPVLPQNQCGYCGLQFGNSRIYIEHMVEVSKNLKRIKTDKAATLLAKVPKLEEEEEDVSSMETDNNIV